MAIERDGIQPEVQEAEDDHRGQREPVRNEAPGETSVEAKRRPPEAPHEEQGEGDVRGSDQRVDSDEGVEAEVEQRYGRDEADRQRGGDAIQKRNEIESEAELEERRHERADRQQRDAGAGDEDPDADVVVVRQEGDDREGAEHHDRRRGQPEPEQRAGKLLPAFRRLRELACEQHRDPEIGEDEQDGSKSEDDRVLAESVGRAGRRSRRASARPGA